MIVLIISKKSLYKNGYCISLGPIGLSYLSLWLFSIYIRRVSQRWKLSSSSPQKPRVDPSPSSGPGDHGPSIPIRQVRRLHLWKTTQGPSRHGRSREGVFPTQKKNRNIYIYTLYNNSCTICTMYHICMYVEKNNDHIYIRLYDIIWVSKLTGSRVVYIIYCWLGWEPVKNSSPEPTANRSPRWDNLSESNSSSKQLILVRSAGKVIFNFWWSLKFRAFWGDPQKTFEWYTSCVFLCSISWILWERD